MIPGVTTIFGEPGTCKSSIATTWPKPLAFYDLENGARRVWGIDKLIESKQVLLRRVKIPNRSLTRRYEKLDGYSAAWNELTQQIFADLESKQFKSLVWDTGTLLWALDRDAYLEERQREKPNKKTLDTIEYAEPNRRLDTLYAMVKTYDIHLAVTHHDKDEYVTELAAGKPVVDDNGNPKQIPSGKKLPDGFKQTLSLSDLVLYTTLEIIEGKVTPKAKVYKSLYGLSMRGLELEWPTFEKLDSMVKFVNGG